MNVHQIMNNLGIPINPMSQNIILNELSHPRQSQFSSTQFSSSQFTYTQNPQFTNTIPPCICFNCESKAAEYECANCINVPYLEKLLCAECAEIHPRIRQFRNHDDLRPLQRRSSNTTSTAKRCEHGRQTRDCKDCGGSRICEHGRIRRRCRPCGG